jgi:phytol kinase
MLWKSLLALVAMKYYPRYKRTINYTRKLGNAFKLYKFFVFDDFLPEMRDDPMSLLFIFFLDQILYMLMFSHHVRFHRSCIGKFCDFLFLQQNRPEDRPDTLIYQVTEDLMRFAVYLPFRLWIVEEYFPGHGAIIYIPVTINSIGDGLAEPVGVFFSTVFRKRLGWDVTYTTRSLYTSQGGFWSGNFRRSYPGSACVFITTIVTLLLNTDEFTQAQVVFLLFTMPVTMTVTEALAPHTNDGPFLALLGCGLLVIALSLVVC